MRVFSLLFSVLIFAQEADILVDSTTQNLVKLENVTISAIRAGINTPISFNNVEKEQIEIESIYSTYLSRQKADIEDFKREEGLKIPKNTNFKKVGSLSNEIVEKLSDIKPPTLGAASRISGVTPAALISIMRFLKKQKNRFYYIRCHSEQGRHVGLHSFCKYQQLYF